jgi:hypothetical protein
MPLAELLGSVTHKPSQTMGICCTSRDLCLWSHRTWSLGYLLALDDRYPNCLFGQSARPDNDLLSSGLKTFAARANRFNETTLAIMTSGENLVVRQGHSQRIWTGSWCRSLTDLSLRLTTSHFCKVTINIHLQLHSLDYHSNVIGVQHRLLMMPLFLRDIYMNRPGAPSMSFPDPYFHWPSPHL